MAGLSGDTPIVPVRIPPPKEIFLAADMPGAVLIDTPPCGTEHRRLLSNDLGAIAALCFDVGSGRLPAPPRTDGTEDRRRWETALAVAATTAVPANSDEQDKVTHTEVQGWLRDLGLALSFQVWIATNDHNRPLNGGRLGECCLDCLLAGCR